MEPVETLQGKTESRSEYRKRYRAENYTGSFEKKIKELIYWARKRAKKQDIECTITVGDFIPITHCPLLGIKLNFSATGRGFHDDSPSIDRIDPSKGYVPGNVWIISSRANRIKSNATLDELVLLVNNIMKIHG